MTSMPIKLAAFLNSKMTQKELEDLHLWLDGNPDAVIDMIEELCNRLDYQVEQAE